MVKKGFYFLMVSLFYASLFAESQINLHCNAHSPVISLFFVNPGFLDATKASGIVGAYNNPAALGHIKGLEIGLGATIGAKSSFTIDLPFSLESEKRDTEILDTKIPFNVSYKEKTTFDYFGVGYSFGLLAFGFTYLSNDETSISLDGLFPQELKVDTFEFKGYLTSREVEGLPQGDSVPVIFKVSGKANLNFSTEGHDNYIKEGNLFFGMAFKSPFVKIGIGLKYIPMELRMNTRFILEVDTLNVDGKVEEDTSMQNIDVDASLDGYLNSVELMSVEYKSDFKGKQIAPSIGVMLKVGPIIFLSMGATYYMPATLSGYYERITYLPDENGNIVIDTVSQKAQFDPVNQKITGEIVMMADSIPVKKTIYEEKDLSIPGKFEVRGGLKILFFGIGGGASISQKKGFGIDRFYLTPSFSFGLPFVRINAGIVGVWTKMKDSKGEDMFSFPNLYGGLGLAIKPPMKKGIKEVGFGLKMNILSAASNMVKFGESIENKPDLSEMKNNFAFSFGMLLGF